MSLFFALAVWKSKSQQYTTLLHTAKEADNVKIAKSRTPDKADVNLADIPEHQTDAMARTLIGCITRLFEDPAIKADYERWKRERQAFRG